LYNDINDGPTCFTRKKISFLNRTFATPLYCLVSGDPEISVFGIKYDKNMTVDRFRDAIKNKLSPLLDGVAVKDLPLYQVDINLTMANPYEPLSVIEMSTL